MTTQDESEQVRAEGDDQEQQQGDVDDHAEAPVWAAMPVTVNSGA